MRDGEVVAVDTCRLAVRPGRWPYEMANSSAIEEHWKLARARNPGYFNGAVQILVAHRISAQSLHGTFLTTDFASFLYWRSRGNPDVGAYDCFGCAILRSADGALMLGVQSGGNLNSGRAYCPGGFIDAADVAVDGTIDIDGSIAREVAEEAGLEVSSLRREPGYLLVAAGSLIAIGVAYRSKLKADELRAEILQHLRSEKTPELSDIMIVRTPRDIEGIPSTPYVPALVNSIL